LDIKGGNRLADYDRQIQLQGALDLFQLAGGDVGSDGLGHSLHGLGGYLQTSQEFHPLAALLERGVLAERGLHAAHSGRELGIFDIQFDIGRELPGMAVRAQIVGARDSHLAHGGEDSLGA
jgi:hypothetical protein